MKTTTIIIIKLLIFLILTIYPVVSLAETFSRFGTGMLGNADRGNASGTHLISLGFEDFWFGPLIKQYEVGAYFDSAGENHKNSGFGSASMGVESTAGPFVLRALCGVGAITTPDSVLGGWFQFNQDFLVMLRDKQRNAIGINYKHLSSFGIYEQDLGRDFVLVHMEIPW